jgi:hypothetical protein
MARLPWYKILGRPQNEGATAAEAFDNLGRYDVALQRVFTDVHDIDYIEPCHVVTEPTDDFKAIVRGPMHGEPPKVFNIVGNKYRLIKPLDIVTLWDEHIGLPVTSIGALDDGERFFLATKMPTSTIAGDIVSNVLVLMSPMNGRESITALLAPVRLVCTNGLVTIGQVSDSFNLRHYQKNIHRLPEWLAGLYQRNIANLRATEGVYREMAGTHINSEAVESVLETVFPLPDGIDPQAPADVRDKYVKELEAMSAKRHHTRRLFGGEGTGSDTEAAKGTAFGLFNAIVELIDYGVEHQVRKASARSASMGLASYTKRTALKELVKAVR